jgi:hypothetical protein
LFGALVFQSSEAPSTCIWLVNIVAYAEEAEYIPDDVQHQMKRSSISYDMTMD